MRNFLLAIESAIILIFCISWCYILQRNTDNMAQELHDTRTELHEVRTSTEKEIRLLKQDIKLNTEGWEK